MIARLIEFLDERCEEQSLKDSWTLEEEKLEFISRKAEEITNRLEKKLDSDVSKKKFLKLEVSHDHLSWTACYEDDCLTHISEKEEFEWFSKKSRKISKQERVKKKTSTSIKWRKWSSTNSNEKKSDFLIKNLSQKCNMIALQQINLVSYARTFQVSIYVNEHRFKVMIDSSATKNFMTKTLIEEKSYSTRKKSVVYVLITIDEQLLTDQNEKVNEETKSL